jgi:hypothetical protein
MSATKALALATLCLATTLARAEWEESTFPDGNFRAVFPNNSQRLRGSRRNLHQFQCNRRGPESRTQMACRSISLGFCLRVPPLQPFF